MFLHLAAPREHCSLSCLHLWLQNRRGQGGFQIASLQADMEPMYHAHTRFSERVVLNSDELLQHT